MTRPLMASGRISRWLKRVGGKRPPALPNSDSDLCCMTNLTSAALSYPREQWAMTPLVSDLAVVRSASNGPKAELL